MVSSTYINEQRRAYSLYVMQMRAIPHLADGLKAGARRVLWTARDGGKYKSATLAGATMPIHPHASPEGAINTLAAPYGNNIPLLEGIGAFGTLLNPTAYGASRYTSVKVSAFTKDVLYKDIELIPMVDNYDSTLKEPKHFLPLIPIILLNPSEGLAIGFSSIILPRSLHDIISAQITHLKNRAVEDVNPYFKPTDSTAHSWDLTKHGNVRWFFSGEFTRINSTNIQITKLPYGTTHSKFVDNLIKLLDSNQIVDYNDESSDKIDIKIKFKRGFSTTIDSSDDQAVIDLLGLTASHSEIMNVIDLTGQTVLNLNFPMTIQLFTDWRLQWYLKRYQRLLELLQVDIQRYNDVILAIRKNVAGVAKKTSSRKELIDFLEYIGIVHTDYVVGLPVYRFTTEELDKVKDKLKDALLIEKQYKTLIKKEALRRQVYISELQEIQSEYS